MGLLLALGVGIPCLLLAQQPPAGAHNAGKAPGKAAGQAPASTVEAIPRSACTPAPLPRRAAAVLIVGLPGVLRGDQPLARAVIDLGVSGIFLGHDNVQSATQVRELVAELRRRAGRPLLVSTDEESGRVAVTGPLLGYGPSPRRLARQNTPQQVRAYAGGLGKGLRDLGINLDLAPVADLDAGPAGGVIGDRSFAATPTTAEAYSRAFAEGLADSGVTPTVKHFPGQGRSAGDTHARRVVVRAALGDLQVTDLSPFQRLIDAGAPVVMLNHLDYTALDPDLPASLSPAAYGLLRTMGFRGVAMTDSLGMGAVNLRWDFPEAAVRAIAAGADAAFATDGKQAARMRDALVAAVRTGRLPQSRLDEAAARVTALAGGDPQALTCTTAQRVSFPAG